MLPQLALRSMGAAGHSLDGCDVTPTTAESTLPVFELVSREV